MSATAAHLVDRVFPEAPVRQSVLSLPFALRTRLAFDQTLCDEVLRIFTQSVFGSLKRRARKSLQLPFALGGAKAENYWVLESTRAFDLECPAGAPPQ